MWTGFLLGSVLWVNAAAAQNAGKGPLFPNVPASPAAPNNSSLFPRDAIGTSAPIGAGSVPVDLLTGKPQATGDAARRAPPADPLRGLVVTPDQLRAPPPSEYRAPVQAERARPGGAGGVKPSSPSSAAPADPLKGLVNDTDHLLQFNGPKAEPAAAEASARAGEEGGSLFRVNRTPTPTAGVTVPDLTGGAGVPGGLSLPSGSMARTGTATAMPSTAPDIATLNLSTPSLGNSEQRVAAPSYRPSSSGGGSDFVPREKLQYSMVERLLQLFLGTLEQPLSYVLLLGVLGVIVALKLRRA